jgi:hypothetical protein
MSGESMLATAITGVVAVLCGAAIFAQDKHTLQVPNGLPFSDSTGCNPWRS